MTDTRLDADAWLLGQWPNHCGCVDCRTAYQIPEPRGWRRAARATLFTLQRLIGRGKPTREEYEIGSPMTILAWDDPEPHDFAGPIPVEGGHWPEGRPRSPACRWRTAPIDQFRKGIDHQVAFCRRVGLFLETPVPYAELRRAGRFSAAWLPNSGGGGSAPVAWEQVTVRMVRR